MEKSREKWLHFLDTVHSETSKLINSGCIIPYYRGHFDSNWTLTPSLFRTNYSNFSDIYKAEGTVNAEFHNLSGNLYDRQLDEWEIIFEMRHAGLPTRMLDWTENFANALFFAINDNFNGNNQKGKSSKACIWILNPFALNKKSFGIDQIPTINSLIFDELFYRRKIFYKGKKKAAAIVKGPIAVVPQKNHQRIFAQKSVFTFHYDEMPLEKYYRRCLKKIEIPNECRKQAELFLFLSGVNEYSIYPDLDGLGKYLRKRHSLSNEERNYLKK